jgi:NTP pyrophosphatase (non-canonical NTP hydrolase)
MLTDELKDKLTETLAICDIHHQRMMFAFESVKKSESRGHRAQGTGQRAKDHKQGVKRMDPFF